MSSPSNILFIFVDGLGIGKNDESANPCTRSKKYFRLFDDAEYPIKVENSGIALALDATLDLPGLPQSATGQTALLTGVNASQLLGRHLNGLPNAKLRDVIREKSIFKWFAEKDLQAAFLNAFRPPFFDHDPNDIIKFLSVTTVANLAAGLEFFGLDDLKAGRCVYQDITSEAIREKGFDAPLVTPEKAGKIIGRRSQDYHFSLFEYFQTDKAGHSQNMEKATTIITILETFFESVLQTVNLHNTLVLLTSDHGNIENISFRGHTRNPAMTLLFGSGAETAAAKMHSILDVYPTLVSFFH